MKFTKRALEAIEPVEKRQVYFDDSVTGLAVKVMPTGHKSFYFCYRAGKGRGAPKRQVQLGAFPDLTVEQARNKAKRLQAQVVHGQDPAKDIQQSKDRKTVSAVLEVFFKEHVRVKLKPHTIAQYEGIARRCVIPAIGNERIEDVTHRDVAHLHHRLKNTPYQANRTLAMLSKFFSWCEVNGFRERMTNPAFGLEKYKEKKQMEFMDQTELSAVGQALESLETAGQVNALMAAALRLLALTGARVSEILSLKWEYIVDL
ncbi:MAG: integrase arm-type DNA-binding domain-containing protein, partial [Candidatus Adiutrix sp.]|nr:integrase arm-type DNA-binding domain-containing protein [Candidatus Adiutrix sp.]